MTRSRMSSRWILASMPLFAAAVLIGARAAKSGRVAGPTPPDTSAMALIARGRQGVLAHGCGG